MGFLALAVALADLRRFALRHRHLSDALKSICVSDEQLPPPGNLIGEDYNLALGINFDYTSLVYANRILVDLMSAEADLRSAMWQGGERQLSDLFDECLAAVGKPVASLNKHDRLKVIALLDQKSAFSYRKSVPFVAKRLQVSRYTVYKYLSELADGEKGEE